MKYPEFGPSPYFTELYRTPDAYTKEIYGYGKTRVNPFVGANLRGGGIGFIFIDEASKRKNGRPPEKLFWYKEGPVELIKLWRASKILEIVPGLESPLPTLSLGQVYNMTQEGVNTETIKQSLRIMLQKEKSLRKAGELSLGIMEINGLFPDSQVINQMILNLSEYGIAIDKSELQKAITDGKISETPVIKRALGKQF